MATLEHEKILCDKGFTSIAGVDEAGRGPLAGPVVAAAVILPENFSLEGVTDSKKVSPVKRKRLYEELIEITTFGVGVVDAKRIDEINILQATFEAMLLAVSKTDPDFLLIDGNLLPKTSYPARALVKGDSISLSIAAASIIAKEYRDRLMYEYHDRWPEYGFDKHKGYGTKLHLEALALHGPCEIHRMTFRELGKTFTRTSSA